jgi:hypothetical protein
MNSITFTKLFSAFRLKSTLRDESYVHAWDQDEMKQIAAKLGISQYQLNDAVLETGSLYLKDIKNYLRSKGVLFSFKRLWQHMHLSAFLY